MVEEHASVSTLPTEIMEKIFLHLNPNDLRNMQYVCPRWRDILKPRRHLMNRLDVDRVFLTDSKTLCAVIGYNGYQCDRRSKTVIDIPDNEHSASLFELLWSYEPRSLSINGCNENFRKTLKSIPDWWFESVREIVILEKSADLDLAALLSRCPYCHTVEIDPCYTVDNIISLLRCMKKVTSFKYRNYSLKEYKSNRDVKADDSTIDALIRLSQAGGGMYHFGVEVISTDFTLEKIFEFFEKGNFRNTFTFFIGKVRGSDREFKRWLRSHAQRVDLIRGAVYSFIYRNVEFTVQVGGYAP